MYPALSAVHAGTVEESEVGRLITEPHAALTEAGFDITPDTPVHVNTTRELVGRGRGSITVIIIVWGDGSVTIIIIWRIVVRNQ